MCFFHTLLSLTGMVGTIKASLSESSNNSNQVIGIAILTSAFGTGLVIGPSLSGAIADPIGQYNLIINSELHNLSHTKLIIFCSFAEVF